MRTTVLVLILILQVSVSVYSKSVNSETESTSYKEVQEGLTITGKVIDKDGLPLIGVNIIFKGTTIGTATDVNGEYSLNLPDENGTLIFSYIGFINQEINISGQKKIDITLKEDAESLNEVVVVGYNTVKQNQLTSAVAFGEFWGSGRSFHRARTQVSI